LSQCFCVEVGENFNKHKINVETSKLCLIQSLCCGNVVDSTGRRSLCHISGITLNKGVCGESGCKAVVGSLR
jgi:hypothetical protein